MDYNKECEEIIENMFDEFDATKEYLKMYKKLEETEKEKSGIFKEMAKQEYNHFKNLHSMAIKLIPEEEKSKPSCFDLLHERYVKKLMVMKEKLGI